LPSRAYPPRSAWATVLSLLPFLTDSLVVLPKCLDAFCGNFDLQDRDWTRKQLLANSFLLGNPIGREAEAQEEGKCGSQEHAD